LTQNDGGYGCDFGCGSSLPSYNINASASSATVTIQDNDNWTVGVVATNNLAKEGTPGNYGLYTITRTGETDLTHPLTVYFTMAGTATYSSSASYSDYQLYNASGSQIYLSQTYDYTTYE